MSDDLVKELRAYDRPHQYLTDQPTEVSDAALNFALTLKRYEMTDAIVAGVGYVPVGKIKEAADRIEALEAVAEAARAYIKHPLIGTHIELGDALSRLDAQKDESDD